MIKDFKDKKTRLFFEGERIKEWQSFQKQAEKRLQILDSATCLDDLKYLPSNHFEVLKGDRKEQFSIRINMQWRICFKFIEKRIGCCSVDYH